MRKVMVTLLALQLICSALSGQTGSHSSPLQGGENAASAFILAGPLPIISTGTTEGYLDDYDETCPYEGSTAPDVVYAFTPPASVTVDIDLCGSSFDTKLYIYEGAVTPGAPLDCNDDFYTDTDCGLYVSKLESILLTGGTTYYIVIDGYDAFAYGNYILTISDNSPPPACSWGFDIVCPSGAVAENEPCGSNTNGGCDMPPGSETWEIIPDSGAIICGTLWAIAGNRDSDWFELVLSESSLVILTADADNLIEYGLITGGTAGYQGNPDCSTVTGLSPSNSAGPCNETILDLGLLEPGTYWFSVSLAADNDMPCDKHYWIDFYVIPQPCPAPVEVTTLSITDSSAVIAWTESGAAGSWEYQIGATGFIPTASGTVTTSNPLIISGLISNTAYDFYVRSSCDPAFSSWEGPLSFTTLCGALAAIPWSEGFEPAWPPSCWLDNELADYGWDQSSYGTPHSGNEWAYCNLAGSALSTPAFSLALPSVLSFWFKAENSGFPQAFSVRIGNDILYQVSGATNTSYKPVYISLYDYTGETVSVTFLSESGNGGLDFGLCLDDISVTVFNTWTGDFNSEWNNSANWSKGAIPGQWDALLIPSVPSGGNFPVISGGINAECDHITIMPGATMKVISGNSLEIINP